MLEDAVEQRREAMAEMEDDKCLVEAMERLDARRRAAEAARDAERTAPLRAAAARAFALLRVLADEVSGEICSVDIEDALDELEEVMCPRPTSTRRSGP